MPKFWSSMLFSSVQYIQFATNGYLYSKYMSVTTTESNFVRKANKTYQYYRYVSLLRHF